MGFLKRAVIGTAMVIAVVAIVGQGGALADVVSDATAVAGTGGIFPGLPTSGCAIQTAVNFGGIGDVVGDDGLLVPATVNFNGNSESFCETLNSGEGAGTLSGTFTSAPGGIRYVRSGPIVQVAGSVAYAGETHAFLAAVCVFVPASVNPVVSYALVCAVALSSSDDIVSDATAVAGTGGIFPGLPTSGCAYQTAVNFGGVGDVVGDDGLLVPAAVNFGGSSSICETLNAGQGGGSLNGTFTGGSIQYVRSGPIVQLTGTVAYAGQAHSLLAAICIFVPASFNPVVSYALLCGAALGP